MHNDYPDHHDAELVLRLYELRREPVMREARDTITRQFLPRTFEDVVAVLKREHPLNAAYRQVSSYWEMAYGMVRHGIVHPEYFMESNGEGLLLLAKVWPFLEEMRAQLSPRAYLNAEWAATQTDLGRQLFAAFGKRIEAQRAAA